MKTKEDQHREWLRYKPKAQAKYYARRMAETGCSSVEEYKEYVKQKRKAGGNQKGGNLKRCKHEKVRRVKLSAQDREELLDSIVKLLCDDVIETLPVIL